MIVGAKKKKTVTSQKETIEAETLISQPETNEQFILQTIENRDYSAASTFIEFLRDELKVPYTRELALWNGYSLFHLGEYQKAIEVYRELLSEKNNSEKDDIESDLDERLIHLYIASCEFYNQDYEAALQEAEKGPSCDFRTRLIFHISHQRNDEEMLLKAHSELVGTLENQMSLAAIHYLRTHYQDAI